ncbi:MAG TPA: LapA family protein [Rhabdaerophilum sp.]|nr:LapA family protein [Rhabdaerophilum sp.]
MVRFLKWLILAPVAIALVMFGVANRQLVTLVLDPISSGPDALKITVPLFAFFFGTLAVGAIVGSMTTWLAQGRHRRAERHLKRECDKLSGECARLKSQLPAASTALIGSR